MVRDGESDKFEVGAPSHVSGKAMKQPGAPLYSPQDVPGFKEAEMSALQVGDKYRSPATRRLHIHWMRVENPLEFYETIALYKCGSDGKNSNLVIAESAGQKTEH